MCSVFFMVYSCWEMLFAHKLLHQDWMLISMSYPVGPQPKSLQSVTPASTFFSFMVWELQVLKQPRLWPTVSSEITPKKYCSVVKFTRYTLLSCRKVLFNSIKGSPVSTADAVLHSIWKGKSIVFIRMSLSLNVCSRGTLNMSKLMSNTGLDWGGYQNCLSGTLLWSLPLILSSVFPLVPCALTCTPPVSWLKLKWLYSLILLCICSVGCQRQDPWNQNHC